MQMTICRPGFRFLITSLIVLSSAALVPGQSETDEANGDANARGKITGRVLSESGQPLANVVVNIRGYAGSFPARQLTTDGDGSFQATNLAPMAYLISVTAPGYVQVPRDADVNPVGYYRVGDSVRLEMMKGGVITGTVKRSNGEPVVAVVVRTWMLRDNKGKTARYSVPVRSTTTDDRGVYRIYGLAPGTYIVAAGGGGRSGGYSVDAYGSDVPTYAPASTRDAATEISVNS